MQLKNPNKNLDCININGYYVNCVEADDVEYMEVELQEHRTQELERTMNQKI